MTHTTREAGIDVHHFNRAPESEARTLLESCLAVPRWVDRVLAGRPYRSGGQLTGAARALAAELTADEVDAALARHPRIGEAAGAAHDVEHSRREQAAIDTDDASVRDELADGNREYEARFGRVFLIRAAGRTSREVLGELRRRLQNAPEAETAEVVRQLTEIASLRLERVLATGLDRGR